MRFDRRSFLKLLLATAVAEAVDVEQLLWVPKPIITVPEMPYALIGAVGGINQASFTWWRNIHLLKPEDIFQHDTEYRSSRS